MRFLFQLQLLQQVVDDVLVCTAAVTKPWSVFYTAELECLAVLKVRSSRKRCWEDHIHCAAAKERSGPVVHPAF